MKKKIFVFFVVLCFFNISWSQNDIFQGIPDSLKSIFSNKNLKVDSLKSISYKLLANDFRENKNNFLKAESYAKAYLEKAKTEEDAEHIIKGFILLKKINKGDIAISYCDSLIKVAEFSKNIHFETLGYYYKGSHFFKKRDFKNSLENLLKSNSLSKKNGNEILSRNINYSIGLLKSRMGENKEALDIFKNTFQSIRKDSNYNKNPSYLRYLYSLSNAYRRNKILDSAMLYCNLGIKESIISKNKHHYSFILIKGVLDYQNHKNDSAIKTLNEVINYYENNKGNEPNLAFAYYFSAKALLKTDSIPLAIVNLKKVDSIFQETSDIHPEIRNSYEILIDHYKNKNDSKRQLVYIERLLRLDSILNNNYRYISKKIINEYDTPELLAEKEELIDEIEKKKKNLNYAYILAILVILIILMLNYMKKQKYKKKFEQLLNKTKVDSDSKKNSVTNLNKENSKSIGISKEIVEQVLLSLSKFEEDKEFIKQNTTVNTLAKAIGTNSRYLSKIINVYKQKPFITYLSDLRLEYSIEKIKTDKKFRSYTVSAIAEKSGFGQAESFAKAFYKKTGIKPSYFIKKIEDQHEN